MNITEMLTEMESITGTLSGREQDIARLGYMTGQEAGLDALAKLSKGVACGYMWKLYKPQEIMAIVEKALHGR